jgi:hypothetical protein
VKTINSLQLFLGKPAYTGHRIGHREALFFEAGYLPVEKFLPEGKAGIDAGIPGNVMGGYDERDFVFEGKAVPGYGLDYVGVVVTGLSERD